MNRQEGDMGVGSNEVPCVIMVVDDDPAMRSLLVDELQDQGCRVIEAGTGIEALTQLAQRIPDLIVTDLRMPAGGFDFLRTLHQRAPTCPIVLITAFGDSQTKVQALECGVTAYLEKPVRIRDLKASLSQICRIHPCKNSSIHPIQLP